MAHLLVNMQKADNSQTVATDNLISVEKVIEFLSKAYMEEHGDIKDTYNPMRSSSSIQAVAEGDMVSDWQAVI